jgi:nucleotide-binding universal stress UspA family protein
MKGYRKILIAVNGCHQVLEEGLRVAGDEKCWVTVLKVVPPYEGDLDLTGIRNIEDVLGSMAAETSAAIEGVVGRNRSLAKIRVEEGDIPETIAQVAAEEKCDLIIMGTKKAKGLFRRFLGDHTAGKVIGRAPCPVLVVHD